MARAAAQHTPSHASDHPLDPFLQLTGVPMPDDLGEAVRRLRRAAGAAVEELLCLLDGLDGDADLEPSLGSPDNPHRNAGSQVDWADGAGDDREDESELLEDDDPGEEEPDLEADPAEMGLADEDALSLTDISCQDVAFTRDQCAGLRKARAEARAMAAVALRRRRKPRRLAS